MPPPTKLVTYDSMDTTWVNSSSYSYIPDSGPPRHQWTCARPAISPTQASSRGTQHAKTSQNPVTKRSGYDTIRQDWVDRTGHDSQITDGNTKTDRKLRGVLKGTIEQQYRAKTSRKLRGVMEGTIEQQYRAAADVECASRSRTNNSTHSSSTAEYLLPARVTKSQSYIITQVWVCSESQKSRADLPVTPEEGPHQGRVASLVGGMGGVGRRGLGRSSAVASQCE